MRQYKEKDNVQKKSYFSDRFYVTPSLPRLDASEDEQFAKDLELFSQKVEVKEAFIEHTHLVIHIDKNAVVDAMNCLKEIEYDMLMELSAIDYIAQRDGFEIFYEMLSLSKH